jgi:hypothetical protein
MQTYVFIEEKDFSNQQIVNDDVVFRLKALAQSTYKYSVPSVLFLYFKSRIGCFLLQALVVVL